eukprot:6268781-Prorocentrum_lima.AAC.1
MTSSLVGSEMCIRDRYKLESKLGGIGLLHPHRGRGGMWQIKTSQCFFNCLLYTSDAADDM